MFSRVSMAGRHLPNYAFFDNRPITSRTPYTSAASDPAIPPTKPKIAKLFHTVE